MRIIVTIALAVTAAAILVPAGFGQSGSPDDRPGIHGIGPSSLVTQSSDDRTFVRGSGSGTVVALSPDDRPSPRGTGASPVAVSPDDRGFVRRIGRGDFDAIPVSQPTTTITTTEDGFHWGDAGIGLVAGIALMLLAAGAIVTLRRSRHTLAHQ